jgi:hypothetical protein
VRARRESYRVRSSPITKAAAVCSLARLLSTTRHSEPAQPHEDGACVGGWAANTQRFTSAAHFSRTPGAFDANGQQPGTGDESQDRERDSEGRTHDPYAAAHLARRITKAPTSSRDSRTTPEDMQASRGQRLAAVSSAPEAALSTQGEKW